MNSDFEKRFPLVSMLLRPAENLSEDEMMDLLNSLSDRAFIQLSGELLVLNTLMDLIDMLSKDQIDALARMSNYQNN